MDFVVGQRLHSRYAISAHIVYVVREIKPEGLIVSPESAMDCRYFVAMYRAQDKFYPAEQPSNTSSHTDGGLCPPIQLNPGE